MKKHLIFLVVLSLLAGSLLTMLFTAQLQTFSTGNCNSSVNPVQANGVMCAGFKRGYPVRFITSGAAISTDEYLPEGQANGQVLVSSDVRVSTNGFVADWVIWSSVSFIVLYVMNTQLKLKPTRKKRS